MVLCCRRSMLLAGGLCGIRRWSDRNGSRRLVPLGSVRGAWTDRRCTPGGLTRGRLIQWLSASGGNYRRSRLRIGYLRIDWRSRRRCAGRKQCQQSEGPWRGVMNLHATFSLNQGGLGGSCRLYRTHCVPSMTRMPIHSKAFRTYCDGAQTAFKNDQRTRRCRRHRFERLTQSLPRKLLHRVRFQSPQTDQASRDTQRFN